MRKINLLHLIALGITCAFIGTACKKPVHSNNPTPNNVRLSSYTKISTATVHVPLTASDTLNENYRFYYDDKNRVIKMTVTTNDPTKAQQFIAFTYKDDTVLKVVTDILTSTITERDTLVFNSLGQLTTAYMPGLTDVYEYYGKLLARHTYIAHDNAGATVSATTTYTSVNGDLLANNFDNNLTANFPSSRTAPFNVYFLLYNSLDTIKHTGTGYTDVLGNYAEIPGVLFASDNYGAIDTVYFPGQLWRKENYHFDTEKPLRTGDYLQIQSFTKYGYNIYANNHLVSSISSLGRHANITYQIDAYSNITQTNVVTIDSVLNNYTSTYNFQYETY